MGSKYGEEWEWESKQAEESRRMAMSPCNADGLVAVGSESTRDEKKVGVHEVFDKMRI